MSWLLGAGPRLKIKVTFRPSDRINKVIKNRIQVRCSPQEGKKLHLANTSSNHKNKRHGCIGRTQSSNVRVTNIGTAQRIINRGPNLDNKGHLVKLITSQVP